MPQAVRIEREKATVRIMIKFYCQKHHKTAQPLCPDCLNLLAYSHQRLDHCPFGENKTVCGSCPIHCYRKEEREKIQRVMRYSGPRMIFYHPLMAVQHVLDKQQHKKIRERF